MNCISIKVFRYLFAVSTVLSFNPLLDLQKTNLLNKKYTVSQTQNWVLRIRLPKW